MGIPLGLGMDQRLGDGQEQPGSLLPADRFPHFFLQGPGGHVFPDQVRQAFLPSVIVYLDKAGMGELDQLHGFTIETLKDPFAIARFKQTDI